MNFSNTQSITNQPCSDENIDKMKQTFPDTKNVRHPQTTPPANKFAIKSACNNHYAIKNPIWSKTGISATKKDRLSPNISPNNTLARISSSYSIKKRAVTKESSEFFPKNPNLQPYKMSDFMSIFKWQLQAMDGYVQSLYKKDYTKDSLNTKDAPSNIFRYPESNINIYNSLELKKFNLLNTDKKKTSFYNKNNNEKPNPQDQIYQEDVECKDSDQPSDPVYKKSFQDKACNGRAVLQKHKISATEFHTNNTDQQQQNFPNSSNINNFCSGGNEIGKSHRKTARDRISLINMSGSKDRLENLNFPFCKYENIKTKYIDNRNVFSDKAIPLINFSQNINIHKNQSQDQGANQININQKDIKNEPENQMCLLLTEECNNVKANSTLQQPKQQNTIKHAPVVIKRPSLSNNNGRNYALNGIEAGFIIQGMSGPEIEAIESNLKNKDKHSYSSKDKLKNCDGNDNKNIANTNDSSLPTAANKNPLSNNNSKSENNLKFWEHISMPSSSKKNIINSSSYAPEISNNVANNNQQMQNSTKNFGNLVTTNIYNNTHSQVFFMFI